MGQDAAVGGAKKIVFATSLTEYKSDVLTAGDGDVEGVGTTREDQYGNKYRWVRNISTVAARPSAPCTYDADLAADATFLQSGQCPGADADIYFFAGVWMAAVPAYASGLYSYGWVLTNGVYATAKMASAETGTSSYAAAVGDVLSPSTLTTTTGTNASRAFAFLHTVALGAGIVGTGAGTAITVTQLTRPSAIVISCPSTVAGSATTTSPLNVLVKGFI